MKIVDAFLFSEAHEKEIFLLKLILSDKYVDEWVVCENAYSHQGDYIGLLARQIIETDERFAPYRKKITVIEREQPFEVLDKTKVLDGIAFKAENWQRGLAYPYFMEKYSDEDWIAINDVDEMFDFTDEERVKEFFEKLEKAKEKGMLKVPRLRYWYDFDNQHLEMHASLLCTKAFLSANPDFTLSHLRKWYTGGLTDFKNPIIFEYSSCFDVDHIVRKLETNPHTGVSKKSLIQSLRCNHRSIAEHLYKSHLRPNAHYFFETVELNAQNSPLYVRQNLARLKTNVVDKNYKENRRKDYPQFYTFYFSYLDGTKRFFNNTAKVARKKFRFFLRRIKLEKAIYE